MRHTPTTKFTAYLENVRGTFTAYTVPKNKDGHNMNGHSSMRQYLTIPDNKHEAVKELEARFFEVVHVWSIV